MRPEAGTGAGASGSSSVAGGTTSWSEAMFVATVQPSFACWPSPESLRGSSAFAAERFRNLSTAVTS